ncbi:hypothetical protein BJX99DRAFT_259234 [Aspergillus californicus]
MGPYVPPGHSPPFQVVDDLHHGAWIIITVALGLVFSLTSFLIRLYVRLALHPPFGKDDYVLLGATILAGIQASLVFGACAEGLGTSIDLLRRGNVDAIQILIVVSETFYLITLYTTKCCVISIYLRLTPQKLHNRASWATFILCTLWVIPAIFILSLNCGFNRPWTGSEGQCTDLLKRWQFIVAIDIATELILFSLAVWLLAGLFMPLKRKLTVAFAFLFRLPLTKGVETNRMIAFAILHIYHLQKNFGSQDPTLDAVQGMIWSQVELHYALVACSVFCLRPFMAAVSTNYGTAGDSTLESSRDASKQKSGGSNTVSGSGSGNRASLPLIGNQTVAFGTVQQTGSDSVPGLKRARTQEARVMGPPGMGEDIELVEQLRGGSIGSDRSAKMIIRKDVQYTVEYGGARSPSAVGVHNEVEYWDRCLETQRP